MGMSKKDNRPPCQKKVWGFSPAPSFFSDGDLQTDYDGYTRKITHNWYFRNETQSETSRLSTLSLNQHLTPQKLANFRVVCEAS